MKNKAVLVGINQYPDPRNTLRGCINDILDMEHFISETNKVYQKENIKKITDQQATKKEIITQLKWLLDGAQAGDQLLFHYSGHGAQSATQFPLIEKDGLDEIICPFDYFGSQTTAISDKEFAQLFAGIPKGVHFVWISDSCHAKDLSRNSYMPRRTQYRNFNGLASSYQEKIYRGNMNQRKINQGNIDDEMVNAEVLAAGAFEAIESVSSIAKPFNGALLSACASNELSADAYINDRFNGAFTHYLIKNLLQYSDSKSMQAIIKLVNIDLDKNGYAQNPEVEGLLENKTFFS